MSTPALPAFLMARFAEEERTSDVEAKRRVVELAVSIASVAKTPYEHGKSDGLNDALRLLALPYADHPEHQEGWRP